jgi:hypothetical protein
LLCLWGEFVNELKNDGDVGMIRVLTAILTAAAFLLLTACQKHATALQESTDRVDETVAIRSLRSIDSAQKLYSVSHEGNYATLDQLSEGGYLDPRFKTNQPIRDYVLTLNLNSQGASTPSYSCRADPVAGRAGRHFYIDSLSGTIHGNPTQPASASDPAIE